MVDLFAIMIDMEELASPGLIVSPGNGPDSVVVPAGVSADTPISIDFRTALSTPMAVTVELADFFKKQLCPAELEAA